MLLKKRHVGRSLSKWKEASPKRFQQYEDALVALSERPTAHLYLALACYARFLVEGKTDAGLAERAREEMREALRIDPGIEPDPRLMSPRVAILLEEIRRGAAPH